MEHIFILYKHLSRNNLFKQNLKPSIQKGKKGGKKRKEKKRKKEQKGKPLGSGAKFIESRNKKEKEKEKKNGEVSG